MKKPCRALQAEKPSYCQRISQIGLIEAWGTGLQRIQKAAKEYELPEHQSINDFTLNVTQLRIVEVLSADSGMTGAALAEQIGISKRNIETNIKK